MKTAMEFITFDNSDVIATSGEVWFQVTAGLVPDHVTDFKGLDRAGFVWSWSGSGETISKTLSIKDSDSNYIEVADGIYQLDKTSTGTISGGDYTIFNATKLDAAGDPTAELTTLQAIFAFLGVDQ